MSRLEEINRDNWQEFVQAPLAMMMLGKSDCAACKAWAEELTEFLSDEGQFPNVRFGKLLLDQGGMGAFKKENAWLADVENLPHNAIFRGGEMKKEFVGSGIERMTNRLNRMLDEAT